jgi:hypothetical protein
MVNKIVSDLLNNELQVTVPIQPATHPNHQAKIS